MGGAVLVEGAARGATCLPQGFQRRSILVEPGKARAIERFFALRYLFRKWIGLTELILGLPGETLETWKENFYGLFKMGNHTGITVFQAQLLENAEMNLTQKKQFEITHQPVSDYFAGSYSNEHVTEYIDVITGTKDMPFERMLDVESAEAYQDSGVVPEEKMEGESSPAR